MADITMLLQQMKLAASLATKGEWSFARSGFNSIVQAPVALLRGGPARVVLCKLFRSEWRSERNTAHDAAFIALANPANVMTLVEALEATEKTSAARKEAIERIHKMFQRERDRAEAAEKRIAELEARTVTLPDRKSELFWPGYGFEFDNLGYVIAVKDVIRAAGIGVKGE
ncbi:TPA: ead/Ea22-like family protein [Citrobacter freundii]